MKLPHHNLRALAFVAGCAVAIAVASGAAVDAGAQDAAAIESRIASARSEAQGIAAEIEAKTARLAEASERARAAAARESRLAGLLAQGRARATALSEQVARAEARLEEARNRLGKAIGILEQRLVAIYKGKVPDSLTLILQADGFEDLVTRADYLDRIQEADGDLIMRVRELRADVEAELAAVREARAEQESFNRRIDGARSAISAARAAAESEAAALAAARSAQASGLAELRSRVSGWTKQVERLQNAPPSEAQQQVGEWVGSWAIPQAVVMCESGGNLGALNPSSGAGGAYQILPSTWKAYGGKGLPHNAAPAEQHRIARQIWADSGSGAWVCAG